jgi:hypothetical protein
MNFTRLIDRLQCDDCIGGCPRKVVDGIAGLALVAVLAGSLWQSHDARAESPSVNPAVDNVARVPKAILYEEDTSDPKGQRFRGAVTWRTERVKPRSGQRGDLVIRADVEIPDRKLGVTWSLESTSDPYMTHIFEITFRVPSNFPAGDIMDVPGIMMKEEEDFRGVGLRGYAVKVTDTFFMIGLSRFDGDLKDNLRLLRRFAWFDIPIRYRNHRRAILAIEKGASGERAFTEALAAWGQ